VSDYRDPAWLRAALVDVLEFYHPACVDERRGGFRAGLDEETGAVVDPDARHLVASARFAVTYATGRLVDGPDWCGPMAGRAVAFLHEAHRDPGTGGYHWLLDGREPADRRRVCYGHAFVLLAYARAARAGVPGTRERVREAGRLLSDRFFEPAHGLYRSEFGPDWDDPADYRGQNANMHACEAHLEAHVATGEAWHLRRALRVARTLTVELAAATDGLLWEHYTREWDHDLGYNRDRPADTFRPWGYQPGHHLEWAKLLALLDRAAARADGAGDGDAHGADAGGDEGDGREGVDDGEPRAAGDAPDPAAARDWLVDRAVDLFEAGVDLGWDDAHGGLHYTVDPDGDPVVDDTYGWAVAEGIGAAAALRERTGDDRFGSWYDRLWTYADAHLVTDRGSWRTRVSRTNEPRDPPEGPAVEPGYHPVNACFEARRSLSGEPDG
jgi:mannose/cellobiose epimerase-like protein (N-acyl-D-glucosamine 2-epimerase family)